MPEAVDEEMTPFFFFSAFAPQLTTALVLDVFSFHMCSSLHQKQRKLQEIAACISRKRSYFFGSRGPEDPDVGTGISDEGGDKEAERMFILLKA